MFEILRQVQESMAAMQETCSHEEYAAYRRDGVSPVSLIGYRIALRLHLK